MGVSKHAAACQCYTLWHLSPSFFVCTRLQRVLHICVCKQAPLFCSLSSLSALKQVLYVRHSFPHKHMSFFLHSLAYTRTNAPMLHLCVTDSLHPLIAHTFSQLKEGHWLKLVLKRVEVTSGYGGSKLVIPTRWTFCFNTCSSTFSWTSSHPKASSSSLQFCSRLLILPGCTPSTNMFLGVLAV